MNWVFLHGWGFGKECWEEWPISAPHYFYDRGYFADPQPMPPLDEALVITHSFGLHLLPPVPIKRLAIIGGFKHIHSNRRTQDYLLNLEEGLKKVPKSALEHFYDDCGLDQSVEHKINLPLLLEDLHTLKHSVLDIQPLRSIPKILLLHGSKDRIAPLKKGIELHRLLPGSELIIVNDESHALPFLQAAECVQRIKEILC